MSHLPLRALGIPVTEYSSLKTIRVLHSIRRLLGLYPFVGNPRRSPVSQGKKLFSYDKLGLYFTVERYLANQRSVFSPFLSQLSKVKHITATVTYCLQSSGWVATTYILHVSVRKFGNCRSFSQTLLGLYPRAKRSTVIAWDLRRLS